MKTRLAALSSACIAALAAAALLAPLQAGAQNKGEIRIAHVYSKTGPLEAYGKQTQTGFMMGLDYATNGTMMVGRQEARRHREGRPGQARPRQVAARHRLCRRQGRHRRRPDVLWRGAGNAAGGRGIQEDPAGRAGGGRLDHRRQVEQVHLPHRPQQLAGRDLQCRGLGQADGVSIGMLAQDYAFGRDGVKAFSDALKKTKIVHEEYLPPATTDFTAGIQHCVDALKDKPGRKVIGVVWAGASQSLQRARRPGPEEALRHRGRHRRQHPAGHGRLQALPGHGGRDLLLLRHSRRTRSTNGWSPSTTSSSRRRPTSSPPAASRRRWRSSTR